MGATDIGCFAKHILKIIIRILRIVLHHEFHGNTRKRLAICCSLHSNIYLFVNITPGNELLFIFTISLRRNLIASS